MEIKRIEIALWLVAILLLLNCLVQIKPYFLVISNDRDSQIKGYRINSYTGTINPLANLDDTLHILMPKAESIEGLQTKSDSRR